MANESKTKFIAVRATPFLIVDVVHVLGDLVHEVDDEALVTAVAPAIVALGAGGVVVRHQERLVLKQRIKGLVQRQSDDG